MSVALTRTNSPETSYQAALRLETTGKRAHRERITLAAVIAWPGQTAGELGEITDLGRVGVAPRLTGLFHGGQVTQGPRRRCAVQGTWQVTWLPTVLDEETGELL